MSGCCFDVAEEEEEEEEEEEGLYLEQAGVCRDQGDL